MTILEKVLEKGKEGEYRFSHIYLQWICMDMAKTIEREITISLIDGELKTKNPQDLTLEVGYKQGVGEVKLISFTSKEDLESSFERENSQTEEFELVMGDNAGYFHNNENFLNFESIYQEIAKEVFINSGIYISATIDKSKVIYSTDWGCPEGGEDIYIIKGTCNTTFAEIDKYKKTVRVIAESLAERLSQSTFTLTWSKVDLNYFTKKGY